MPEVSIGLRNWVRQVAERGASEALRYFRQSLSIENKLEPHQSGGFDPVTEADRAAERVMRQWIETEYPDHGIFGEEYGVKDSSSPWQWVLDPIDGTRGFVAGMTTWMTLVGLEYQGEPVVGAMVQPFTREIWHGYPEGLEYFGPMISDSPSCKSSAVKSLEFARLSTTDPRATPAGYFSESEAQRFSDLSARCRVSRFSSDAYAYALLASGHMDVVAETGLQKYDVSAIIPVVRASGAYISSWSGGSPNEGHSVLAASTSELHQAALEVLSL